MLRRINVVTFINFNIFIIFYSSLGCCSNSREGNIIREVDWSISICLQYTEERLGTAGRTELDAHFESLAQRADDTKLWTERLLSKAEAVLEPNPNVRVEDYLFDKVSLA